MSDAHETPWWQAAIAGNPIPADEPAQPVPAEQGTIVDFPAQPAPWVPPSEPEPESEPAPEVRPALAPGR
jgi:hypothetical protein